NIAAGAAMLSLAAQEHDVWPPGSPRHLEITREGDGLRLRWERPDADADGTPLTGLQGYFVYRATDRDGPYERLHDQPVTSAGYQDSYASERGSWYRVTAVDYRRPPNEGPPCEPVGWDPPRKH
ncbi:MAG: hypothetical protein QGI83_15520, partial [Candidatus Latescibacteria bacterium]|nr:hypothetical protein [Candidatus Latescibacterota bacterium]